MAIISSSSLGESNEPSSNKELRIVGSEILAEEKTNKNINLTRPNCFEEFVGQEPIKSSLKIAINASIYRGESLEHVLLYGQPGLGKTSLAMIIAKEINTKCKVASAPSIERPRDIVGLLLGLKQGEILFIDEIHRLNKLTEELLYSAIASISAPLRDRFGICQKISLYSEIELQKIILNFSNLININLQKEASLKLAKASRGTPRIALRLLKRIRDYAQVIKKSNFISVDIVERALNDQKIDDKGLDEIDRKFLSFLNLNNNAPIGLESIAAGMGEDSSMLEFIVEPFLIQNGFIIRTPRGRILTSLGKKYIDKLIEK